MKIKVKIKHTTKRKNENESENEKYKNEMEVKMKIKVKMKREGPILSRRKCLQMDVVQYCYDQVPPLFQSLRLNLFNILALLFSI
ncbi:hypothetical protein Avbf_16361 [Armadillidium vulgare]|nr:hypothetical protein Avbf_16361 [Armadillidium vulgare]